MPACSCSKCTMRTQCSDQRCGRNIFTETLILRLQGQHLVYQHKPRHVVPQKKIARSAGEGAWRFANATTRVVDPQQAPLREELVLLSLRPKITTSLTCSALARACPTLLRKPDAQVLSLSCSKPWNRRIMIRPIAFRCSSRHYPHRHLRRFHLQNRGNRLRQQHKGRRGRVTHVHSQPEDR